jgi:hypothetical protein
LKKRSKKRLTPFRRGTLKRPVGIARGVWWGGRAQNKGSQKFFGGFFQKSDLSRSTF